MNYVTVKEMSTIMQARYLESFTIFGNAQSKYQIRINRVTEHLHKSNKDSAGASTMSSWTLC